MRQLFISVPKEEQPRVDEAAEEVEAVNVWRLDGETEKGPISLTVLHVANDRIEPLLNTLGDPPELHVSFLPFGALPLRPPAKEAPEQVRDVAMRSPLEIFLSGIQSVGSWTGFLGYAVAAGVIVWLGLFTNTIYLLTAAMLIAPFAGPAMNSALATASGDAGLLKQGVLRYAGALSTTIVTCAVLTLVAGPVEPTPLMMSQGHVSVYALLLPLVAGAAGALNLMQSTRDSLVTEAGAGMLVAASLAPPAGLVGMAGALGHVTMAGNGLFLLVLQLAGINLGGFLTFRLGGLSTQRARYQSGNRTAVVTAVLSSLLVLGALMALQLGGPLDLRQGTIADEVRTEVIEVLHQEPNLSPVAVDSQFSQLTGDRRVLLVQAHARTESDAARDADPLSQRLRTHLRERWSEITFAIDLQVMEGD